MPALNMLTSPTGGPDMIAYLYVIASAHQEFYFAVFAFRKKAANFRLSSRGHIDPQIYSKAFTDSSKVEPDAHCSLCLSTSHITLECTLYSSGPAKKAQTGLAGPEYMVPLHDRKACTHTTTYITLAENTHTSQPCTWPCSQARVWAGRKEPGTYCLCMLSFPRISGSLEIPIKSAPLH